jgi:hypothetical protein
MSANARRRLLLGGAAALAGVGLLSGQRAEAQTPPPSKIFNVRAFGAMGDGSTDDTDKVEDAIDAAWTQGGVVYLPPGRYRCSRKLRFVQSPAAPHTPPIAIVGEGRGISSLEFVAGNSGIEFLFANADRQLTVSSLSIKAGTANAGCALNVTWPHDPGPYARAHIEDLEICPLDPLTHYWNYGLRLTGGHLSVIRAVWFRGMSGSRQSICAIELVGSNDVSITGCHTNFSDVAIHAAGGDFWGDTRGCEGTVIRDCMMVGHNVGVLSLSHIEGGLPWIEASSCHIFASYRGIQVKNRNEVTFAHNIIYQADTSGAFVGIECQANCAEASIHDNRLVHQEAGSHAAFGIVHSGKWSQVNHNVGTMVPCVVFRGQAEACVAVGNISRVAQGTAVRDETPALNSNKVLLSQPA